MGFKACAVLLFILTVILYHCCISTKTIIVDSILDRFELGFLLSISFLYFFCWDQFQRKQYCFFVQESIVLQFTYQISFLRFKWLSYTSAVYPGHDHSISAVVFDL